ncbi:MAG: methyltransferase family protein [Dongiaceae bacterium]
MAEAPAAWRLIPLIGVVLLIGVPFLWRSWLQRRRYGTRGVLLFRSSDRGQMVRDGLLLLVILLLLGQALAAVWWPAAIKPVIAPRWLHWLGAALMFGGIVLLVAAQLDLGASWRIGIDESARPGLVEGGLYRFSRNPIFLGLLIAIAGYAALLPTPLSVILLAGQFLGMRLQIAAEEAYLLRTYGDAYRAYARRVGRLLPWMGRFH